MKKRATERDEKKAKMEEQKGKEGLSTAKPTPAKRVTRAHSHSKPSETSRRDKSRQEEGLDENSRRIEKDQSAGSPSPVPSEPLGPTSPQQSPAGGSVVSTASTESSNTGMGSKEQEKLAEVMRARAEAAKKGAETARLWAEQQKSKGKGRPQ
jgi:hypothetical protein